MAKTVKKEKGEKIGKKINNRFVLFFSLLLAVVLIVVIGTTAGKGSFLRLLYLIGEGITGSADEVTIQFDSNNANRFQSIKGGFAVLSVDGMHIYSFKGDKKSFTPLTYQSPALSGGLKNLVAYDRNGQEYTVVNKKKVLHSGHTDAPIINISMNDKGAFAVVTAGPDSRAQVAAYDKNFKFLYRVHSAEQYILSAHISEDNKYMVTLGFSASTGQFGSRVSFYKLHENGVFKYIDFTDCMPIDAKYLSNNELVVLFENKLVRFNDSGDIVQEIPFDSLPLDGASLDSMEIAAVQLDCGHGASRIIVSVGNEIRTIDVSETVFDISCAGEYTALLYNDRIVVYNKKGEEFHTFPLVQSARECIMRKDGTVFAVGSNFANLLVP